MTSVFYVNNVLRSRNLIASKLILFFVFIQFYIFIFDVSRYRQCEQGVFSNERCV